MDAKKELQKKVKEAGGIVHEFRNFISRGNVIDLAVGVIIGGAFGKIVTSLVDNIIMPLIGVLMGGIDFSALSVKVADAYIGYGIFIQNVIDFLIIAACIFVFIKLINRLHSKTTGEKAKKKDEQLAILKEIRDSLVKK